MYELFCKVYDTVKPAVALVGAGVTFLLFPTNSYVVMFVAIWIAVALDLFTRWNAIFKKAGGIRKAIHTKAWNSHDMFEKTGDKIKAYLVIEILAGLSVKFVDIPYVSNAVATAVYSFLFFREFTSNIENLIDAGANYLKPMLFWMKKKEKNVFKKEGDTVEDHSKQV